MNLEKKNKEGGITLPDTKAYSIYYIKDTATNTPWCLQRGRCLWNIIEDPETDLHKYAHLIFDKVQKQFKGRKVQLAFQFK